MASFDLIYLDQGGELTMSAAVSVGDTSFLVGPFPAIEAGPKIVEALLAVPELGLVDRRDAETRYIVAHFRNMSRRANDAGQSYPFRSGT